MKCFVKNKVSLARYKRTFKPNIHFEEIQSCYKPLKEEYEIKVVFTCLTREITSPFTRTMLFTLTSKEDYERTLKILKSWYYNGVDFNKKM